MFSADPGAPDTPLPDSEGPNRRYGFNRRRRWLVAAAVTLLALVGGGLYAGLSGSGTPQGSPLVGATNVPAPDFSIAPLRASSRTVTLEQFRGRNLVVNFWASWCIPCRTEMPLLESTYRSEGGKVAFLGIDNDDTRPDANKFLAQVKVTYPSGFDPSEHVAAEYGLYGLPETIFISAGGKLKGRLIGQLTATSLDAALQHAFGKSAST